MKKLIMFICLIILAGCATPQQQVITIEPQIYQAEHKDVWVAIIDTLDGMGFTPAQMQKEDGFITTERRIFESPTFGTQHIDFATALRMSASTLPGQIRERVKVTIRLSEENGGTKVKVNPYIEHSQGAWVQVESNGKLENEIQNRIASRLN